MNIETKRVNNQFTLTLKTSQGEKCVNAEIENYIYHYAKNMNVKHEISFETISNNGNEVNLVFNGEIPDCWKWINSLKSATSRKIRTEHKSYLKKFCLENQLWSKGYTISAV